MEIKKGDILKYEGYEVRVDNPNYKGWVFTTSVEHGLKEMIRPQFLEK